MAKAPPPAKIPPLARALDQRVEDLRALTTRALRSWDVEAIHHARVTTRRLKAAIDLLRPLLPNDPRRKFGRALRRLRRTLGPLRDLDVMLIHLEELRDVPACAHGAAWFGARLRERRADLRRTTARGASARQMLARLAAWVDLEPGVRDAQAPAALLLRRVAPGQARDFARRADRLAATPQDSPTPEGAGAASTEDVHELRIAGKLLRYTLELAEPLGCEVPRSVAREFKKLQDALGLWHDYAVLTDEMLKLALDRQLSVHDPQTYGAVLDLARACWQKARRHLDQFQKHWTAVGAELTSRVVGIFTGQGEAAESVRPEPAAAPAPAPEPAPVSEGSETEPAAGAA